MPTKLSPQAVRAAREISEWLLNGINGPLVALPEDTFDAVVEYAEEIDAQLDSRIVEIIGRECGTAELVDQLTAIRNIATNAWRDSNTMEWACNEIVRRAEIALRRATEPQAQGENK